MKPYATLTPAERKEEYARGAGQSHLTASSLHQGRGLWSRPWV